MKATFNNLSYFSGFGNDFESEALAGALPVGQNNPKKCPFGLYAEQLSGSAFTAPRKSNQRVWFYRIRPSVTHEPFQPLDGAGDALIGDFSCATVTPNQLRWAPPAIPQGKVDFLSGLFTICGTGSAENKDGYAIHMYTATASMGDRCLCNADGDLLIVPQLGTLLVTTEHGRLRVDPGEIVVIQRGIRFSIALEDSEARGYVLEVFAGHFVLPDLGPIGANGLANPRDFKTPVAWYEDRSCDYTVIHKFGGQLFSASQGFSPFNVVAWHGNYAPYKYDLARFCPMNAVAFDHPDPSIFTVLTCPSAHPGTAIADFVIFPPRWTVAENTFRPPYFHRNIMSEFMGMVRGEYDGKAGGFVPGASSLHMCMTPHGPDASSFELASAANEGPAHLPADTLAFMFETYYTPRLTARALQAPNLEQGYYKCWQGLKSHFNAPAENGTAREAGTQA